MQCLPVLPTNPIHTPGRPNTGVHKHVNFTGGSNPAPTDTKTRRQNKQKRQNDSKTTGLTNEHCPAQRRKATQRGTCQQTHPKRFATKMQPRHTEREELKTIEDQRWKTMKRHLRLKGPSEDNFGRDQGTNKAISTPLTYKIATTTLRAKTLNKQRKIKFSSRLNTCN